MTVGKEHVRYITALWAGLDIGPGGYSGVNNNFVDPPEANKAIQTFPILPSIIVQSGRGIHLYWLLESSKEITNLQIVEDLLKRLNSHFRCNSPVGVDSTLRLPGTWNPRGFRTPVQCIVEHLDSRLRYSPRDFQDFGRKLVSVPDQVDPRNSETAPPVESAVPIKLAATNPAPVPKRDTDRALPRAESVAKSAAPEKRSITETPAPPIQNHTESVEEATEGLLNRLADNVADRAAERFITNHAEILIEKIADRIVEKLAERIRFPRDS